MVLDPNIGDFSEYYLKQHKKSLNELKDLELQLSAILSETNLELVELFHKIAVRCEQFVKFCEIHRRILMGKPYGSISCCKEIFNQKPFFTTLGTCYTTNVSIWESYPFTFSNIKVWLDVRTNSSPGNDPYFQVDYNVNAESRATRHIRFQKKKKILGAGHAQLLISVIKHPSMGVQYLVGNISFLYLLI